MDLSTVLFLGGAVLAILFVIGIVNQIKNMIASALTILLVAGAIWYVMPIQYKATVDLSLALSGSKIFEEISPQHVEIIRNTKVVVNFDSKLTLAYPSFVNTPSNKTEITNENNHDFNMDMFTFDKELESIRIISTPKNAKTVERVLSNIGIKIKK